MTKESNSCGWCEDLTNKLILYSRSKGAIIGFCSEECWTSFSEILFEVSVGRFFFVFCNIAKRSTII